MVIYLRHSIHGEKVACLEQEAIEDEKNGWERFDPNQKTEPDPVKRKPGRPKKAD